MAATEIQADTQDSGVRRFIVPIALVLVMAAIGWGIFSQMGKDDSGPKRQTVKIAVLPSTPPPPPPPKEEKKPEPPKEEPKQTMPTEPPKVQEAPVQQAEALKMDGPAGDGPSAFQSGSITSEYKGGAVSTAGATASTTANDRAKYNFYAKSMQQLLRSELDRSLPREVIQMGARLRIWVDGSGRIERYEVEGLRDHDAELRLQDALTQVSKGFRLVPPAGLPQPLEMRLSVNPVNG